MQLLPTLLVVLTCCWLTRRPEAQCPHGVGLELAAAGLGRLADPDGSPADWLVVLRAEGSHRRRRGRQHAKAGNLNEVLPHCHGELMAVFDADVMPHQPQFPRRTVWGPWFVQARPS